MNSVVQQIIEDIAHYGGPISYCCVYCGKEHHDVRPKNNRCICGCFGFTTNVSFLFDNDKYIAEAKQRELNNQEGK